jgi:hypothetical protein
MDHIITPEIDEVLNSEAGTDAVLNTAAAGESNIRVIFRRPYANASVMNVSWDSATPTAECKSSDISLAQQNDTVTVNGVTYKIDHIEAEDSGWSILVLYKAN